MVDMSQIKIETNPLTPSERAINDLCFVLKTKCHGASVDAGWYTDLKTGEPIIRNKGEMLMLIVSEIAEAMEGERKHLPDKKLKHRQNAEVELADAVIRIFDYAGYRGFDLGAAIVEKMRYNAVREDHKIENRAKEGGKAF